MMGGGGGSQEAGREPARDIMLKLMRVFLRRRGKQGLTRERETLVGGRLDGVEENFAQNLIGHHFVGLAVDSD